MKSLLLAVCLVVAPLAAEAAPILSFAPSAQSVTLGSLASVDVVISGLEQGETIGAFDFILYWDSSILSLSSTSFGSALGGSTIDDVVPGGGGGVGSVNAASVSLEDPATLLLLQSGGSFTAFTAVFNTLAVGTTSLTFGPSPFVFSDGEGLDIAGVTGGVGSVTVTDGELAPVPEPGTMLMMASGLGAAWLKKRRNAAKA
jgi:hypothetical protein